MQKIKMLAQKEIYKIAAGQVIDRPANVVKEMIENSIDAGATNISIYIEDGGKELIRVADNGCGMSPEDAKFCIKKHATSKISSLDDLSSINTFGFRGEALASISAVSKTKLTTKETNKNQGVQLELENGTIVSERFVPFTTGTDISVKSLFYNIPVRKKFLKKKKPKTDILFNCFTLFA